MRGATLNGSIPQEMQKRKQWLRWTLTRDGQKIPLQLDGSAGKSNDPTTWSDYSEVCDFDRIAYVIAEDDPFTGIDLDNCFDDDGQLREWAVPIVAKLDGVAYAEVSPSGKGIKFTTRAEKLPKSRCVHKFGTGKQQLECYDKVRFWTITGNVYAGNTEIGDGQAEVDWICQTYLLKPRSKTKATNGTPHTNRTAIEVRAAKYLACIPGAVSGCGGHNTTFHAACVLVLGFDLTPQQAFPLLSEWNAKCEPPWTEKDLWRKVNSADEKTDERGWLLDERGYGGQDVELSHFLASVEHGGDSKATSERLPDIAYTHGQTDAANAARFIDLYHAELLYVPQWRKWLSWDGRRWCDDDGVDALQRAIRYAKSLWDCLGQIAPHVDRDDLAKAVTFIRGTNQTTKIKNFLELAAVDERVVCPVEDLNSDPNLLNVMNGTIDLTTGVLRRHNPADRITQLAQGVYDPDALCPKWIETLELIFGGDVELIRYVQQLLGYSLSADTGEHIFPIAEGRGHNGKSTIWNVMAEVLGDYAMLANDDLLMGDKHNHPTEKAALYQKRFVAISEPEKHSKLKESRVKELTGDRLITARRMKEDFWSFERTHTFWLSTNHLPRIDGTDEGIWRRVKRIPFEVDLRDEVEPIADFDRWLVQNECPGIMGWLVRGYRDYCEHGLVEPECVTAATRRYRDDSDPLGDFLAEHCVLDSDGEASAKELFRVYCDIHKGQLNKTNFGLAMAERFGKDRSTRGKYRNKIIYKGVRIRIDGDDSVLPAENAQLLNSRKNSGCAQLRTVLEVAPRNLANPIENPPNYAQLCAPNADVGCNHTDPSSWQHQDDKAFCRGCGKYMGRVPDRNSNHNFRPGRVQETADIRAS